MIVKENKSGGKTMADFVQITRLKDINIKEKVFVVSPMHPDIVSKIDLSRVDKKVRQHIGNQLRRWMDKGHLYQ